MVRRVFLYLAIPESHSFRKVERTGLGVLRNIARRQYDNLRWRLTGSLKVHYSTYEDLKNSNIGDISVGIAAREAIQNIWQIASDAIVEVSWGALTDQLITHINSEADAFVIGGSGYLHCGATGRLSSLVQADIPKLERLTCPIVTFGVGLNRIIQGSWIRPQQCITTESLELLQRFSRVVTCHSVRDELTKEILEMSGAKDVRVIGDPALHLNKAKSPLVSHRRESRLRIGVNFSFHGPNSQAMLLTNIKTYIAFLKWIKFNFECELIYFAHSDAENFIWKILTQMGVDIEFVGGSPAILLECYRTIDLHVCQMMHSAILAMSNGVPTLNLGYDMKNLYLFKLIGLDDRCRNIVQISLEELVESFQCLFDDREEINEMIVEKQSELESRVTTYLLDALPHLGAEISS